MRKAALHNLGCKVNAYETEAMQTLLEEAGYEIVDFHQQADVYVINTCSVTNIADRKSRQMLHQAKKRNPEAVIVACGCYVQTSPKKVKADAAVDVVIGNNQKHRLVELLEQYFTQGEKLAEIPDIGTDKSYEPMVMTKTAEHTRAFVKVQDGCNQFCTYCIIPYARGRVRSRSYEDVIREVGELAKKGYQEVVLTGIHLSSYGKGTDTALIDLIEGVASVEGIRRVRLGSLEPNIVTEEFAERLSKIEEFCPHFHLSLQSGCDATLKRMNRHYTAEEYLKGCELLRKYFTHPAITQMLSWDFRGRQRKNLRIP